MRSYGEDFFSSPRLLPLSQHDPSSASSEGQPRAMGVVSSHKITECWRVAWWPVPYDVGSHITWMIWPMCKALRRGWGRAPGCCDCSHSPVAMYGLSHLALQVWVEKWARFRTPATQFCLSPLALLGWAGVTVIICQWDSGKSHWEFKPGNGTPPLVGPVTTNVRFPGKGNRSEPALPNRHWTWQLYCNGVGCVMSPLAVSLVSLLSNYILTQPQSRECNCWKLAHILHIMEFMGE